MSNTLAFLDEETTGLHLDRRIWDVGLIIREPGKPDVEHSWIVEDVDLRNADLYGLKIGHFYERHPRFGGDPALPGVNVEVIPEAESVVRLEALTRGATIIGAVPDFDTSNGKAALYEHGLLWAAHYHLVDIENVIVGYLYGTGRAAEVLADGPPWSSEDLSRAVGVEPVEEKLRHTGIGDARWVRDMWDAVTSRKEQ